MRSLFLRVELEDRPGALSTLTGALSSVGVNIMGIDVEHCDGAHVVDSLTLAVPDALDEQRLLDTVHGAGHFSASVRPAERHELHDPMVFVLDVTTTLATTRPLQPQSAEHALRLLGSAEEAWWLPAAPDLAGIVGRASRSRTPMVERTTEIRLGAHGEPVWVLAAPEECGPRTRAVALVAKRSEPFTATQVARVRALVRVIGSLRAAGELPTGAAPPGPMWAAHSWPVLRTLRDGTSVQVRSGADIDRSALLRMHARCSDDTLRNRFFTAKPVLNSSALTSLLPPAGLRSFSVVAFAGGEAIGTASLHRTAEATAVAEVGLLVEDAFQARGLGTILLERIQASARQLGVLRLHGDVFTDNRRMARLGAGAGATAHPQGPTTRLVLDVRRRAATRAELI